MLHPMNEERVTAQALSCHVSLTRSIDSRLVRRAMTEPEVTSSSFSSSSLCEAMHTQAHAMVDGKNVEKVHS